MGETSSKPLNVRNRGANRVIIGPPPRSQRAKGRANSRGTVIGSNLDQNLDGVPAEKIQSNVVALPGHLADNDAFVAVSELAQLDVR